MNIQTMIPSGPIGQKAKLLRSLKGNTGSGLAIFGMLLAWSGMGQAQVYEIPDAFRTPIQVESQTIEFPDQEISYTPTYLIIPPKDPANCAGALCWSSLFTSPEHVINKTLMKDRFTQPGMRDLFYHLWERQNMALIVWNTFAPFSGLKLVEKNEAEQPAEQVAMVDAMFGQLCEGFQRDMEKICAEHQIPKPQDSKWLIGGFSRGAKQTAYMIDGLPAGTFKGAWIHKSTLFPSPSDKWNSCNTLLTINSTDYGYPNYLQQYFMSREQGFENSVLWLGSATAGRSVAERYFDWVLAGKPADGNDHFADVVNLEVLPSDKKDWIPETQRLAMPTQWFTDHYLNEPVPLKKVESGGGEYAWSMSSADASTGEWLPLQLQDEGNVLKFTTKMRCADPERIGTHQGVIVFKDAWVDPESPDRRDDLTVTIGLMAGSASLGNSDGNFSGNRLPSFDKWWQGVDVELLYHQERESVSVLVDGDLIVTSNQKLDFGPEFSYGVHGFFSHVEFGEMITDADEQDSLFVLSPADDSLGLAYTIEPQEMVAVKWADESLEGEPVSRQYTTKLMGQGGLMFEHAEGTEDNLIVGLYRGPKATSIYGRKEAVGGKHLAAKLITVPEDHALTIRAQQDVSRQKFHVFLDEEEAPAISFDYEIPVSRVGNWTGLHKDSSFGNIQIEEDFKLHKTPSNDPAMRFFDNADADENGEVDEEEFLATHMDHFATNLDKNGDDLVDASEIAEQHIKLSDQDGDGKLNQEEFAVRAKGFFAGVDKNKDGIYSRDEVVPTKKPEAEKKPEPKEKKDPAILWFESVDANADGEVSEQEFLATHLNHFKNLDKNGNQTIDAGEFAEAQIKRADKNTDGKLDEGEFVIRAKGFFGTMDKNDDGVYSMDEVVLKNKKP